MGIYYSHLHARVQVKAQPIDVQVPLHDWAKGFVLFEEPETGKVEIIFDDPRLGIQNFRYIQTRSVKLDEATYRLAAEQGALGAVQEWLLKHGDDIDAKALQDGSTALHRACTGGHLPIVEYLMNEGSRSVHEVNYDGHTPVDIAIHNGHWHVVSHILEKLLSSENAPHELAKLFVSEMGKGKFVQLEDKDTDLFISVSDFKNAGGIPQHGQATLKKVPENAKVLFICLSVGEPDSMQYQVALRYLKKAENSDIEYVFVTHSCLENRSKPGPQLLYAAIRANKLLVVPKERKTSAEEVVPVNEGSSPPPKSLPPGTAITDFMGLLKEGVPMLEIIACLLSCTEPDVYYLLAETERFMRLPADGFIKDTSGFYGIEEIHSMRAGFAIAAIQFVTDEGVRADFEGIEVGDLYYSVIGAWLQNEGEPTLIMKQVGDILSELEIEMKYDAKIQKGMATAVGCQLTPKTLDSFEQIANCLGTFSSPADRYHCLGLLISLFYFCRGETYIQKLTATIQKRPASRPAPQKKKISKAEQAQEHPTPQATPDGMPEEKENPKPEKEVKQDRVLRHKSEEHVVQDKPEDKIKEATKDDDSKDKENERPQAQEQKDEPRPQAQEQKDEPQQQQQQTPETENNKASTGCKCSVQ